MFELKEFRKRPVVVITNDDNPKIRISFGLKKARLIAANFQDILAFIETNQPS